MLQPFKHKGIYTEYHESLGALKFPKFFGTILQRGSLTLLMSLSEYWISAMTLASSAEPATLL